MTIHVLGQYLKHNTCIVLQYMYCATSPHPFNHKTWDPAGSHISHKLGPRRSSQPGLLRFWPRGAHGNHLGWDSGGLSMGAIWGGIQMGYAWVQSGMGFMLGHSWVPDTLVAGSRKVFPSGTLIILAAGTHGYHLGLNSGWDPAGYHIP